MHLAPASHHSASLHVWPLDTRLGINEKCSNDRQVDMQVARDLAEDLPDLILNFLSLLLLLQLQIPNDSDHLLDAIHTR